jgi:hypothetical protein
MVEDEHDSLCRRITDVAVAQMQVDGAALVLGDASAEACADSRQGLMPDLSSGPAPLLAALEQATEAVIWGVADAPVPELRLAMDAAGIDWLLCAPLRTASAYLGLLVLTRAAGRPRFAAASARSPSSSAARLPLCWRTADSSSGCRRSS